jgi:hypothetical protein
MRRATYNGDGSEYLNGIPARDLDDEEYQALDPDQRKAVREAKMSGGKPLYDVRTDAELRSARRAEARDEEPAVEPAPEPAQETATES